MLLFCVLFVVGWLLCVVRCLCSRFVACGLRLLFVFASCVEVVCSFLVDDVRCACCVVCCSLAVACDSWFVVCWLFVDGCVHGLYLGWLLRVAVCVVFVVCSVLFARCLLLVVCALRFARCVLLVVVWCLVLVGVCCLLFAVRCLLSVGRRSLVVVVCLLCVVCV